jgi:plasmid stabilization system protein ParE
VSERQYWVRENTAVLGDYAAITEHIEQWTSDRALAERTVDSIRAFIKSLGRIPHRGTKRDDLRPGLRVIAFGKKTAIAFEVDDEAGTVTILRVFYGGQNYEAVLREPHVKVRSNRPH